MHHQVVIVNHSNRAVILVCSQTLFSITEAITEKSQSFLVQSFHPCSLCLTSADSVLSNEFYANLYR